MNVHEASKILGVQKAKSFRAVRNAYRKLAITYHPDKNNARNAEEQFKRIGSAYNVLTEYQKNGGMFPIPSSPQSTTPPTYNQPKSEHWTSPPSNNNTSWQPPVSSHNWQQASRKRRSSRYRELSSNTPPPQTGKNRHHWRKTAPSQSRQQQSVAQNRGALVHAEAFQDKLGEYFRKVFPDERLVDQNLKDHFGPHMNIEDIKQIVAAYHAGMPPLNIEYTPYGKKVYWEGGQQVHTHGAWGSNSQYIQHQPTMEPINAGVSVQITRNNNYQQQPPAQPPQHQHQIAQPVHQHAPVAPVAVQGSLSTHQTYYTLIVNPVTYNKVYNATRGRITNMPIYGALVYPDGRRSMGNFILQERNQTITINNSPCAIQFDNSMPIL